MTELKAYLGLLNFYNKFLVNMSNLLAPLHKLLRKEELWCWEHEQEEVSKKSKELLQSSSVLVHYDENMINKRLKEHRVTVALEEEQLSANCMGWHIKHVLE